jgi:hypothetical protein
MLESSNFNENLLYKNYNYLLYLMYFDFFLYKSDLTDLGFFNSSSAPDKIFFSNKYFLKYIFFKYINLYSYNGNIINLGIVLYNYYYVFVFLCSLILLIALLGCIFLTYSFNKDKEFIINKSKKKIIKNYVL